MNKVGYVFLILMLSPLFVNCNSANKEKSEAKDKMNALIKANPDSLTYNELYDRAMSLWPVDYETNDIPTEYGNAHVIISGPADGSPLVILHGLNSSSTMWYPNIEALAKTHRVYAIDFLLEPNKSKREDSPMTIDNIMDWYKIIFDELALKKFALAGMSRGGWMATSIAMEYPDLITKLALLSPAQTFTIIKPTSEMFKNVFFTVSPERENLRETLQTMTTNVDGIDQLYIDQYYRATTMWGGDELFLTMQPFNIIQWRKLKIPILVLIGDDDIINSKRSIRQAKRKIKDITTGIIPNSGHFLTMDQAAKVNEYLVSFLK